MELMFIIEIFLLVLFIFLGIKLIGKILGIILALISWLIVGSLVFFAFIYPDYNNFKDPSIYLDSSSLKNKTIWKNLSKYYGLEKLKEIREGDSPGKVYIDFIYLLKYKEELESEETPDIEKLYILLKGYEEGKIWTEPEIQNKWILDLIYNYLDKKYGKKYNKSISINEVIKNIIKNKLGLNNSFYLINNS